MVKPTSPFDGAAWVTGASTGIGRATAIRLARRGWQVVVTARSEEKLESLHDEIAGGYGTIHVMAGDVTDAKRMDEIVKEVDETYGGIGLAVLNAGVYLPMTGEDLSIEGFNQTFNVNLNGVTNCLVPLSKAMAARGRGQIALVSSIAGYGGLPTSAAYGATKAALINMAESLKFDFDKMGILIQVINPGFVDTPATQANPFDMPMLMDVEKAAKKLIDGLDRGTFEVTFPKIFTHVFKLINLLPYWAYFPLVRRATKWDKKPLENTLSLDSKDAEKPPVKRW